MSLTPSLGTRRLSAALQILKLQAEIQDVMSKAEAAGEEGDVDVAQELMEKVLREYIHEIDKKISKGHRVRAPYTLEPQGLF